MIVLGVLSGREVDDRAEVSGVSADKLTVGFQEERLRVLAGLHLLDANRSALVEHLLVGSVFKVKRRRMPGSIVLS